MNRDNKTGWDALEKGLQGGLRNGEVIVMSGQVKTYQSQLRNFSETVVEYASVVESPVVQPNKPWYGKFNRRH